MRGLCITSKLKRQRFWAPKHVLDSKVALSKQCRTAALRTSTKGSPLGTYNRSIRESQSVEGLRSRLSPKGSNEVWSLL